MMYKRLPRILGQEGIGTALSGVGRHPGLQATRLPPSRYLVPKRYHPQLHRQYHENTSRPILSTSSFSSTLDICSTSPIQHNPHQQQHRLISSTRPLLFSTDMEYEGVPADVAKLINMHAKKVQTPVSLQALMRTGRGEFLDKHFEDVAVEKHTATELVLMQVRACVLTYFYKI